MKSYHNIRSSRSSVKNIQIIQGGQDLTAQAGLIPVVKFLKKHGFASKIEQTLDHQRGAIGVYDAVDMILLPLVGIVGGARSISSIVTVWNDYVLCRTAQVGEGFRMKRPLAGFCVHLRRRTSLRWKR